MLLDSFLKFLIDFKNITASKKFNFIHVSSKCALSVVYCWAHNVVTIDFNLIKCEDSFLRKHTHSTTSWLWRLSFKQVHNERRRCSRLVFISVIIILNVMRKNVQKVNKQRTCVGVYRSIGFDFQRFQINWVLWESVVWIKHNFIIAEFVAQGHTEPCYLQFI